MLGQEVAFVNVADQKGPAICGISMFLHVLSFQFLARRHLINKNMKLVNYRGVLSFNPKNDEGRSVFYSLQNKNTFISLYLINTFESPTCIFVLRTIIIYFCIR